MAGAFPHSPRFSSRGPVDAMLATLAARLGFCVLARRPLALRLPRAGCSSPPLRSACPCGSAARGPLPLEVPLCAVGAARVARPRVRRVGLVSRVARRAAVAGAPVHPTSVHVARGRVRSRVSRVARCVDSDDCYVARLVRYSFRD